MSAFHLTRRLRLRALVLLAGLAVLTLTSGCAGTAAAQRTAAAPGTSAAPRISSQASSAAAPRYFLDLAQFSGAVSGGQLQVRRSATGALVQQPGILAAGIAEFGDGGRFVVAGQAGSSCASALYRTSVSAAGHVDPMRSLGVIVRGEVTALAADANGQTIAFFAWPCSKSATGYLGVLHVRTGQVRRWGDVNVEGSAGDIVACCSLSLSADGRLALFSGAALGAGGGITGQRVWTIATSVRPGTLRQRSDVVLARPASGPQLDSALLRPDGKSFYLCTVSTKGTPSAHRSVTQTAVITARRTASGARTRTVATLKATGVTFQSQFLGCRMAASLGGHFLLAPYTEKYARSTQTGPLVRAARIDLATRAVAWLSFRLPGSAGMSVATGVTIAW